MIQNTCKCSPVSVRDKNGSYISGIDVISNNGLVKVKWINAFEGPTGFYNPKNPADVNLLRFSIYFKDIASDAWKEPGSATHLTLIPAQTDDYFLLQAAEFIASELQDHTTDGRHAAMCEQLSWLTPLQSEKNSALLATYADALA